MLGIVISEQVYVNSNVVKYYIKKNKVRAYNISKFNYLTEQNIVHSPHSTLKKMKKQNEQTKLQRLILGAKLGFKLSLLPKVIEDFHNYPLVRIFRVIGGVSVVLFLSSPSWLDTFYLTWVVFTLAMLHLLYILIISVIKLCYLFYLWKNKKLQVRNSPLDRLASLTLNLAACLKGGCVVGAAGATVFGLGFATDNLLEEAGYAPVFKKALGNQLGSILSALGHTGNTEYIELQRQMVEVKSRAKNIEDLIKLVNEMENNESFRELKNELKQFQDEFIKELQKEKRMKDIQQSKILKELKNIKKNW